MSEDKHDQKSWLARRLEQALTSALSRAYETIKVDPDEFLRELRVTYALPVVSYEGLYTLPVEKLDEIAMHTIRGSMKLATAEGAGMGVGGLITIVPDLGILSAITMRMVQKLSLIYGFQFTTDEEVAQLWVAAATAAGVDVSREVLEKTVINRFVQAVIGRMASKISAEFAEKAVAKAVPFASSLVGAALNYFFVRAWGKRAIRHFRERHIAIREGRPKAEPILLGPSSVAG